jgi:hypothetical protein
MNKRCGRLVCAGTSITCASTGPRRTVSPSVTARSSGRNPVGLGRRSGDAAAGDGLDRLIAASVIGVPVRVPDLRDRPAALVRREQHGIGFGRVDTVVSPEDASCTSQM